MTKSTGSGRKFIRPIYIYILAINGYKFATGIPSPKVLTRKARAHVLTAADGGQRDGGDRG